MNSYPYILLICLTLLFPLTSNYYFDQGILNLVLDKIEIIRSGEPMDMSKLNLKNRYKIVFVIDGDDYNITNQLNDISKVIDKIGSHNPYTFLIYVRGDNLDSYHKQTGVKDIIFNYPLLYDSQDVFRKANHKVSKQDGYNVFLLDNDCKILVKYYSYSDEFVDAVLEHSKSHPTFIDSPLPQPLKNPTH